MFRVQSALHVQKWEWGVEWESECAGSVSGSECAWEWGAAGARCWGQSCATTDSARERQSQAVLIRARAKVKRVRFIPVKYSAALPCAAWQYRSSFYGITMIGSTSNGVWICA